MSPTLIQNDLLLLCSAFLAGGVNSLAGGGSFLAFPALLLVGVPAINANATCTLALLPGSIASIWPYRQDFDTDRTILVGMATISFIGGLIGALIMLNTPSSIFMKVVPYLILGATLIFAFGNKITSKILVDRLETGTAQKLNFSSIALQFVTAIYGGYFGAGIGIIMLACLSLLGMTKINSMNALKVLLATVINGISAIAFVFAGAIYWHEVTIMATGSIAGGYLAAKVGRNLQPIVIKRFVVFIGASLTIIFFFKS
jgi:uncharacterized membrane protein YfcA